MQRNRQQLVLDRVFLAAREATANALTQDGFSADAFRLSFQIIHHQLQSTKRFRFQNFVLADTIAAAGVSPRRFS